MTYLGRVNVSRENKITAEEKFPISEQGYTTGRLLDGLNVIYYWIPELANHICPNCTICIANHFIHYPGLLQRLRGSKQETNNM